MLTLPAAILTTGVLAKTMLALGRWHHHHRWRHNYTHLKSRVRTNEDDSGAVFHTVILVPLLNERTVVANLVSVMERLRTADTEPCEVVYACTPRDTEGTILALDAALVAKHGHHVHITNGLDTCKADQLDSALADWRQRQCPTTTQTIVGVYDADSKPEPSVMKELKCIRSAGRAFQQQPVYIRSFAHRFSKASFLRVFALTRVLYSYHFSFKEIHGCLLSGGSWDYRLGHFTGHGYFVHLDLLDECGGFSPPSCDTTLGYQISLRHETVLPLKAYDYCEVPNSWSAFFWQGVVWYNGCRLYWREWHRAGRPMDSRCLLKLSWVTATNLSWAVLPWIWFGLLIISHDTLSVLGLVSVVAFWLLPYTILLAELRHTHSLEVRGWEFGLVALLMPMSRLVGTLPPLFAIVLRLFGTTIPLKKTTR
jgi:hypothetical protein